MSEISNESYTAYQPATSLFSASNQGLPHQKSLVERDFSFRRVVSLSPRLLLDPAFDQHKRLESAFSFMVLGRKKAGARELANVLRLGTLMERPLLLKQTGDIFNLFGEKECAYHCYREGLLQSLIAREVDDKLVGYLKSKMADLKHVDSASSNSIDSIIRYKEKTFRSMISELSVTDKARQEIDDLKQLLAQPEFKEKTQFVSNVVAEHCKMFELELLLEKQDFDNGGQDLEHFLKYLIYELTKFPDLNFYRNILSSPRLEQIFTYLSFSLLPAPNELENGGLPKDFPQLTHLIKSYYANGQSLDQFIKSFEFFLTKSLLRALRKFLAGNYVGSKKQLCEITVACDTLSKLCCMKGFRGTEKHISLDLSEDRKKKIKKLSTNIGLYSSFYAGSCLIRYHDDALNDSSLNAVEVLSIAQSLEKYHLSACNLSLKVKHDWIHTALGKLHEWLALKNSKVFQHDHKQCLKKADDAHLETMMMHYLRALDSKPLDEPSIVLLYDKILWGVLMHGGYHLQTFWILKFFRDYACFHSDSSMISYEDDSFYNQDTFKLKENINDNITMVINKLYEQRKQFSKKKGSIFVSGSSKFIIPQLFYTESRTIVASQEYTINESFRTKQNFRVSPKGIVMKGILKADPSLIEYCNKISEDLLEEWSKGGLLRLDNVISDPVVQHFLVSYYDGDRLTMKIN